VGFVVDNARLWHVFSEYFGVFPANHFTDRSTLIIIHHSGLVQWANKWRGLGLTPTQKGKKKY
jgi:hypothetical protein